MKEGPSSPPPPAKPWVDVVGDPREVLAAAAVAGFGMGWLARRGELARAVGFDAFEKRLLCARSAVAAALKLTSLTAVALATSRGYKELMQDEREGVASSTVAGAAWGVLGAGGVALHRAAGVPAKHVARTVLAETLFGLRWGLVAGLAFGGVREIVGRAYGQATSLPPAGDAAAELEHFQRQLQDFKDLPDKEQADLLAKCGAAFSGLTRQK